MNWGERAASWTYCIAKIVQKIEMSAPFFCCYHIGYTGFTDKHEIRNREIERTAARDNCIMAFEINDDSFRSQ